MSPEDDPTPSSSPGGRPGRRAVVRRGLRLARHRGAWILFVVAATLLAPLSWPAAFPDAPPKVHDEYMNLLVSETLAAGRLANPPHPFSDHLQAVYVLQRPAYASPYQPGYGALLALARRITGRPITGVWLAASLMCASILWLLYGYLSPPVALIGLILAVGRLWASYWTASYWGGALTAVAGCLILGAIPRAVRDGRYGTLWLVPLGGSILWLTRPFDAVALALFLLVSGGWWMYRSAPEVRRAALRHLVPATVLIGVPCLLFTMRYDQAVTGDPFTLPYQALRKTQGVPARFFWERQSPPEQQDDPLIGAMFEWQRQMEYDRSPSRLVREAVRRAAVFGDFYLGPLLTLFLLAALPGLRRDPLLAFAGAATAFGFLASSLYPFALVHYLAPYAGVLIAFAAAGIARVARLRDRLGRPGLLIAGLVLAMELGRGGNLLRLRSAEPPQSARAEIERHLLRERGKHLVFVRYGPGHTFHDEWRYNHADIDGSPIVWASERGGASDRALIDYFRERRVWVVEVLRREKDGPITARLLAYAGPAAAAAQTSRESASFARSVMKR